jgi:hypothetical protein
MTGTPRCEDESKTEDVSDDYKMEKIRGELKAENIVFDICIWTPTQQPTMSVVKPEGEFAASVKPGQESCVRSSG